MSQHIVQAFLKNAEERCGQTASKLFVIKVCMNVTLNAVSFLKGLGLPFDGRYQSEIIQHAGAQFRSNITHCQ